MWLDDNVNFFYTVSLFKFNSMIYLRIKKVI